MLRKIASLLFLISLLFTTVQTSPAPSALAQDADGGGVHFDDGIDPDQWYQEHEIEHSWTPDYLHLATGDPDPANRARRVCLALRHRPRIRLAGACSPTRIMAARPTSITART